MSYQLVIFVTALLIDLNYTAKPENCQVITTNWGDLDNYEATLDKKIRVKTRSICQIPMSSVTNGNKNLPAVLRDMDFDLCCTDRWQLTE